MRFSRCTDTGATITRIAYYTDEHTHGHVIEALRAQDISVTRFLDVFPHGTQDHVHLQYATENNLVIVTEDNDFFRHQEDQWANEVPSAAVVFITARHSKNVKVQIAVLVKFHAVETVDSMKNQRRYI